VGQPIQVRKSERFPFIHSNAHLGKVKHGDAAWLEKADFWIECHESVFSGSSHEASIKAYARLQAVILTGFRTQTIFPGDRGTR
jgi:hypothetical protein